MNRFLLFALLGMLSCKTAPRAELAVASDAGVPAQGGGVVYTADVSQSFIEWVGTKPTGRHHGTLKLKEGALVLGDDTVRGGRFIIDINSLQPDDQKASKDDLLRSHLLSNDFFDAGRFPHAYFDVVSVTPSAAGKGGYTVKGNLRLREVSKGISFPAAISVSGDRIRADASFNFNRTVWNMNYGNDKSLGNKFIRPEVHIRLHLVAHKSGS